MNQYRLLIRELKNILRNEGITYAALSKELNVSEATVKRWLGRCTISLQNLDAILSVLNMEISDLVESSNRSRKLITELNEEQELAIANNIKLMLVINCLCNYWSIDDILNVYHIDELECIKLLAELDRLGLIDLLPGNAVRLRFSRSLSWKENGPIQRHYQRHTVAEYFQSRFNSPTDRLLCINGNISDDSLYQFKLQMQQLISDFTQYCMRDSELPIRRRYGATAVVAVRRFEYSAFNKFKRPRTDRPNASGKYNLRSCGDTRQN